MLFIKQKYMFLNYKWCARIVWFGLCWIEFWCLNCNSLFKYFKCQIFEFGANKPTTIIATINKIKNKKI